jgi:hypothetical protein
MRFAMILLNSLTDVVVLLSLLPMMAGLAKVAYAGVE